MLIVKSIRKIFFLLLISLLSISASADLLEDNPWFTSKDLLIKNKTYFELFGGFVNPDMTYSIKSFNKVEQVPLYLWDAGISMRFQRGKWFSISPRITYSCQGIAMNDDPKYKYLTNYLSFSLPAEIHIDLSNKMNKSISKLFFYLGSFIASPVSVNIKTNYYSDWLSYNEMNKINWGGEVGLGFRIPTYSLEGSSNINIRLSYLRGLNDTYSKLEKSIVDQSQRERLYINEGKRFNSAIKLTIGIELPLKVRKFVSFTAGGDGKKNYKRVVVVDEK